MLRMVVVFVAGAIAGAIMLFVVIELAGGWYTYGTLSRGACETMMPARAQIVPHQPNPCHYRLPRWDFFD